MGGRGGGALRKGLPGLQLPWLSALALDGPTHVPSLHLPLLSSSTSLSHFLKIWQVSLAPPLRIIPYNISQGR